MQTLNPFRKLPLELLELIGADLPAHSYFNLRETCRATAKLSQVAKLNLIAFQESVEGWTAENGKRFKALYFGNIDDWPWEITLEENQNFMNNVHLAISSYSPFAFEWMCDNYVGEEVVRMMRYDQSILQKISYDTDVYKIFTLKWAAANGNADVFQTLLQDFRVDPSVDDNFAIRFASQKGHIELVQLLLQDSPGFISYKIFVPL